MSGPEVRKDVPICQPGSQAQCGEDVAVYIDVTLQVGLRNPELVERGESPTASLVPDAQKESCFPPTNKAA